MLGAIIGDVAGSYIEVLEIQGRNTVDRHRSYDERVKIEYIEFKTEDDMDFAERYYIMIFNPKYNTALSDKDFNLKSMELDVKKWKVYLKDTNKEVYDILNNAIKDMKADGLILEFIGQPFSAAKKIQ